MSNSVKVWRGMTNIPHSWLLKFAKVNALSKQGHIKIDQHVNIKQMGWWSNKMRFALVYASTNPVGKVSRNYDVLLQGHTEYDENVTDQEIAHHLRNDEMQDIHVTDVYYSLPTNNRRETLLSLMNETKVNKLIEYVLLEDDGGDWGGDYGGGAFSGDSGGASLYSTFIRPFVDVYETSKYVVETGMSKIQLLSGIATYGIMTMFMPFVKTNFQAMVDHDKRRMRKIYEKYSDVFKRTEQALTETGGNYDGAGTFFVLFPDLVIARNLAQNTATMGKDSAKIAADTAFDFLDAVTLNATSGITDPLRKRLGFTEGKLHEESGPSPIDAVTKLYQHPKIKSMLGNSKVIRSMKQDGLNAMKETIEDTVAPIRKLQKIKNVHDLESVTGKKLDIKAALHDKKVDPSTVKTDEINIAVADAVPNLVKQAAKPFIERLSVLKKSMIEQAEQYGATNTQTFKTLMKLFDEGLEELNDN